MTDQDIRQAVVRCLTAVAPEATPDQIKPSVNIRQQLDIDSIDLLKFLVSLHKEFSIDIPERDYGKLMTVNDIVSYIAQMLGMTNRDGD